MADAAFAGARDGDCLLLAPGVYPPSRLEGVQFVTVTSQPGNVGIVCFSAGDASEVPAPGAGRRARAAGPAGLTLVGCSGVVVQSVAFSRCATGVVDDGRGLTSVSNVIRRCVFAGCLVPAVPKLKPHAAPEDVNIVVPPSSMPSAETGPGAVSPGSPSPSWFGDRAAQQRVLAETVGSGYGDGALWGWMGRVRTQVPSWYPWVAIVVLLVVVAAMFGVSVGLTTDWAGTSDRLATFGIAAYTAWALDIVVQIPLALVLSQYSP
eukprot:TRINITY_DN3947_c0_g1_i1.p1 TRINITY_DN3947_c0_g1~~TRINITY_DN3947_c0_g1_i1.p1  ORF type:complete len:264 (-),score=64.65 TRINITY_DN3947_c0_g1_i1:229-1020(-)